MQYTSATGPPLVRTRAVLIYDSHTGAVHVPSLAKAPAALQPGWDDHGGLRAARRTLASITGAGLSALQGQAAPPPSCCSTAEATNDSLLKGASLHQLVSPAFPSAIVL